MPTTSTDACQQRLFASRIIQQKLISVNNNNNYNYDNGRDDAHSPKKHFRHQKRHRQRHFLSVNHQCFSSSFLLALCVSLALPMAKSAIECCVAANVPEVCAKTLCDPSQPPSDFAVYDVFESNDCSKYLNQIGKCLASGRDHFHCCSREAKDLEESACFGLCRGEGDYHSWNSFQTCLAINIRNIFSCLQRGYRKSPSPPRNIVFQYVGTTEVELSWVEPKFNAHLVDHYLIYLYETTNNGHIDRETKIRIGAMGKSARLTLLEPGTRYAARIIALAESDDDEDSEDGESGARSLPTEAHFKTNGMPPQTTAYKEQVQVPPGAHSVLIACTIRISGGASRTEEPQIRWEHKTDEMGGRFMQKTKNQDRFNTSYYVFSRFRPRKLIAFLKIKKLRSTDFGTWTCKAADEYGESESSIRLTESSVGPPSAHPPATPLQCCIKAGVQERCLSMCGSPEVETKRYVPRPFMNQNCSGEISKVLSCAMPQVDDSDCCIEMRLPSQCLYLCDFRVPPTNLLPPICLNHISSVEQCRLFGTQKRPSSVRNLKVAAEVGTVHSSSILLRWDTAERADIYYVYWRGRNAAEWSNRSARNTTLMRINVDTAMVDEVVVVGANFYGLGPARALNLRTH
ncbi:hypothetical protein niasHT_032359 [Heterodera trifolii]|uniref:Uncharacterized protein n=1 Tax=Heterodera trifolii TaxID=157864 RepID=A0ABD2HSQ4_9BILA